MPLGQSIDRVGTAVRGLFGRRYTTPSLVLTAVAVLIAASLLFSEPPTERTEGGPGDAAPTSAVTAGPDGAIALPEGGAGGEAGGEAGSAAAGGSTPNGAGEPGRAAQPGVTVSPSQGCTFAGCNGTRGVTDTEIHIAFAVATNMNESLAAVGVQGNFGDMGREIEILVDDVNARGGIHGRKIVPHYLRGSPSPDPEAQRAGCVQATEDLKVFAAVSFGMTETIGACMAEHHTLALSGAGESGDDLSIAQTSPWYQMPSVKGITRVWHTLIPTLLRAEFFGKNAKVGILITDRPSNVRVADGVVKPLLARAGVPVEDEFRTSATDQADLQSQIAQAVFRFKTKGITHVLFVPGTNQSLYFMQQAESQNYRPRYALETMMFTNMLEKYVAPAQLKGSLGIGWRSGFDVAAERYPETGPEKRCAELMRKGGVPVQDRSVPATAMVHCDLVWTFEAAARRAGRSLTSGSWVAGLRSLGTSHPSVVAFQTDFGRGRTDANFTHRLLAYDDGCRCFQYRSDVLRDPAY